MQTFDSQIYVYQSGAGIGPLRPNGSCYTYPNSADPPAPTWRTPPKDPARYSLSSSATVRLGPTKRSDEWYTSDTTFGTVLVLRGRGAGNAADYGFTVLDLDPLGGGAATLRTPRSTFHPCVGRASKFAPPVDAAWLVGLALADAWCDVSYGRRVPAQRLCVVGPDWALDVLAAMPGVVVHTGSGIDEGACEAWGRRWKMCSRRGLTAFDVAMRLSGPTTSWGADDYAYGDIATMTVNGHASRARRVGQSSEDRWDVDLPVVGRVTLSGSAGRVRRPCADDKWLQDLVGDGEPIETVKGEP